MRTGRASTALLDRIQVAYYGTKTPLNQLATVGVPEPRLLDVTPYDKNAMRDIERAILESDLGLTPSNDGKLIRLPIPQLTEERRKELVKVVAPHRRGGPRRRAQRAPRRDPPHEGGREEGRDGLRRRCARAEERVQKLTDEHVKLIDDLLKHKEAEILEV